MKQLWKKYNHILAVFYLPFYLFCFLSLERRKNADYYIIESGLDSYIPFCEWFIIPYFLWFLYIFGAFVFLFFFDKKDFIRLCIFLFTGMTLSLVICYLWPNGLNLRPDLNTLGRDNILIRMVAALYATDTSTNVCPSIHVFNSVGACIVLLKSTSLKNQKGIRCGILVLTVLICFSTMFLKQHSIIDVFCGLFLAVPMYLISYLPKLEHIPQQSVQSAD